jgi:bifunctional non-homologous end joining protein LigD
MMASLGAAPGGAGWAFEWKWDGVRAIVAAMPGLVRATSRNGRDVTAGYPELDVLGELVDRPVLLDGELVTLDQHGRPDFGRLQSRMHVRHPSRVLVRSAPVQFYIFDLLHLDGPLLVKPYVQRRELLDQLQLNGGPVGTPANHTGIAASVLLDLAGQHGLEGVVAKRLDSRYVGTGFTDRILRDLLAMLSSHARSTSPFDEVVPREHARDAHWIEPDLVGEVEYRQWTADGRLRHASWRGLRPDRSPREIVLSEPRRSRWPPHR